MTKTKSDTIAISCPCCGTRGRVPGRAAGARAKCPRCAALIAVPEILPAIIPAVPAVVRREYCPCGSYHPPVLRRKLASGAVMVMVLLLLSCFGFLIFWLPLVFMREDQWFCPDCSRRVS